MSKTRGRPWLCRGRDASRSRPGQQGGRALPPTGVCHRTQPAASRRHRHRDCPGLPHGVAGPNLCDSQGTLCAENRVSCHGLTYADRSNPTHTPTAPSPHSTPPSGCSRPPGRGPSPRRVPGTNGAARRRRSSWLPAGDGAAPRAVVPAVVPAAAGGGGAAPPAPGAGAGRRPGLGRRGLAWLGHPDAAAGRAGGGRRAAGALLHAAAVHAVPQPAPQRPLPGRQRRGGWCSAVCNASSLPASERGCFTPPGENKPVPVSLSNCQGKIKRGLVRGAPLRKSRGVSLLYVY